MARVGLWIAENDGGGGGFIQREVVAGTIVETELPPSGQGESCKKPVEIKILQSYCYQSGTHHTMHILFEEQTRSSLFS